MRTWMLHQKVNVLKIYGGGGGDEGQLLYPSLFPIEMEKSSWAPLMQEAGKNLSKGKPLAMKKANK